MSVQETGTAGVSFPGETDEYRRARDDLLTAEMELRRQAEAVAAQRRALPPGGRPPADYVFTEWDAATCTPRQVRLSDLFTPGKDALFIYSFMFDPDVSGRPLRVACPLCTSMLDGIDGAVPHIAQNISFAAAAKAEIDSVRGVDSGHVLRQLVRLGLIAVVQRAEAKQREVSYGTTSRFLDLFNLKDLEDLPQTGDPQRL